MSTTTALGGGIMANAPLAYINGIFDQQRGYAVPYIAPDHKVSNNKDILELVRAFGSLTAEAMQMPDVWIAAAPDIGFIKTVGRSIDRFRMIVASRVLPDGQAAPRGGTIAPSQEPFLIFPMPYFTVRNPWASRWAWNALMALAEAMRHQDNTSMFGIDSTLGGLMSQYTEMTYRQIAVEMLGLPAPVPASVGGPIPAVPTITDAQYAGYDKTRFSLGERIDGGASVTSQLPVEALQAIRDGIPAPQIYSQLQNGPGAIQSSILNSSGLVSASTGAANPMAGLSSTPAVPPPPTA